MARTTLALRLMLPPLLVGMILAISFLEAGVPAVEFGPIGGGHHGPHEWVSIDSLARYRRALVDFAQDVPKRFPAPDTAELRAVEGGLA